MELPSIVHFTEYFPGRENPDFPAGKNRGRVLCANPAVIMYVGFFWDVQMFCIYMYIHALLQVSSIYLFYLRLLDRWTHAYLMDCKNI